MRTVVRAVCFIALLATAAFASITGSISGVVTDSSGAVVTGATVTAVNVQTGIGTFGFVSGSRPARILQIAAKVVF